jgi:hypothetical protein
VGPVTPVFEELAILLAFFVGLGVLTVVLLILLEAAAEVLRLRLIRRRDLRRRFGKRLRTSATVEEDTQELTLEDTQELSPVQRASRRSSR